MQLPTDLSKMNCVTLPLLFALKWVWKWLLLGSTSGVEGLWAQWMGACWFFCFCIYCSCLLIRLSSGWICYAEKTHGSFIIPYISTTKSPQQVMGSLIKGYFAEQQVRSIEQYLIYIPLCFTRQLESKKLSCKLLAKAASPSLLHYLVRSWPLGQ